MHEGWAPNPQRAKIIIDSSIISLHLGRDKPATVKSKKRALGEGDDNANFASVAFRDPRPPKYEHRKTDKLNLQMRASEGPKMKRDIFSTYNDSSICTE